jgi:hypothetical protein
LTVLALGLGLALACLWFLSSPLPVARAAAYEVTKTDASGTGSLRWAIDAANGSGGHDTITFAPSVSGTIELTDTLPAIDDDLTITGPGAITLAISGDDTHGVLEIAGSTAVTISGVTIRNGNASTGGGIYSLGRLLLIGADIVSNTATFGGGVYVGFGSATLSEGQIISNAASTNGGGVYVASGGAFTQTGASTVTHNSAGWGGGVYVDGGRATLGEGQVLSNTAEDNGGGVYVWSGSATLTGGQIVSNAATSGGGVYVRQGGVTLGGAGQIVGNTATSGGGVYVNQSSATFTQTGATTITHNVATYGGGFYVHLGDVFLHGGTILSNTATTEGGGVYLGHGSVVLSGGQIISNTAGRRGGGVSLVGSSAVFTQNSTSAVAHNVALGTAGGLDGGGGFCIYKGHVTIDGGQVFDNVTGEDGGGVFLNSSDATLRVSGGQVTSNTAANTGGGVYVVDGSATILGGQVLSNTADYCGGIYHGNNTPLTLVNSTISHNRATAGNGGGLCRNGTASLTYTTIASNTAAGSGGGIWGSPTGNTIVQNILVAFNNPVNCGFGNGGTVNSIGHNLDSGDTCRFTASTDITDTEPFIGPLTYEQGTWVHPLLSGSRGIDEGICVPAVTTIDQRGVTRPEGGECDIGAYEWVWQKVYLPLVLRNY